MNQNILHSSENNRPERKRNWQDILVTSLMMLLTLGVLGMLLYQQKDLLFSYNWDIRWQFIVLAWIIDGILLVLGTLVFKRYYRNSGQTFFFPNTFQFFLYKHANQETTWKFLVYSLQKQSI